MLVTDQEVPFVLLCGPSPAGAQAEMTFTRPNDHAHGDCPDQFDRRQGVLNKPTPAFHPSMFLSRVRAATLQTNDATPNLGLHQT